MNYREQLSQIKEQIFNDIRDILVVKNDNIKVPFNYCPDDIDDDIQQLIDDEFVVQEGNEGDNLSVFLTDYDKWIDVVEIKLGSHWSAVDIVLIDKTQNIYYLRELIPALNVLEHLQDMLNK